MGAPCLCRQLVLQAAALLIQLHYRVLAIFGQDRTLTTLFIARGQTMALKFTYMLHFFFFFLFLRKQNVKSYGSFEIQREKLSYIHLLM